MVVVRSAELAASGYLVIAKHPWKTGELARAARELGISIPADAVLLRIPPPWSKVRDYLAAASTAQLEAMLNFGEVASKTRGKPILVRLKEIQKALKGRSYGRKPKVYTPNLPKVKKMLEARKIGAVPVGAELREAMTAEVVI